MKKVYARRRRGGFDASGEHAHMHAIFGEYRCTRHRMRCNAAVPDPLRSDKQYRGHIHRQLVGSPLPRSVVLVRPIALDHGRRIIANARILLERLVPAGGGGSLRGYGGAAAQTDDRSNIPTPGATGAARRILRGSTAGLTRGNRDQRSPRKHASQRCHICRCRSQSGSDLARGRAYCAARATYRL